MKRILAYLLATILLFLCGCGKTADSAESRNDGSQTATTQDSAQDGSADNTQEEVVYEGDAYWEHLHDLWRNEKNEGYVWTITIDDVAVIDAMGFAEVTYDLDLSCSHVGQEMNGVYSGSLGMNFKADLSGINELIGSMGGSASTDNIGGWFVNDSFVMDLKPYDETSKEEFIASLEPEETEEDAANDYADAIVGPMLQKMGSGNKPFEENSVPVSYWYDWDYHMTDGDMSNSYSVTGVMGIASASASMDASGTHVSGSGIAHSPLGGVYSSRYAKDFEAPFPYIIHVYESGDVVFELHSPNGGPVVIKFYGAIDKIPVSQTTVVKQ